MRSTSGSLVLATLLAGAGARAQTPYAVPPIVVTGSRTEQAAADAPVATEVVTREEIEAQAAEDLAEILEEQPGLEVFRSFSGAGVRLMGLAPDYTLVLVDGERVAGRVGGVVDLSRFPAEDIERVEIVKGASSALYGSDAIAGVINVITRRPPERIGAEGHLAGGSRGTWDAGARAGGRAGPIAGLLTAGWHRY